MIRNPRDYEQKNPARWHAAMSRYCKYIAAHRTTMPRALFHLIQTHSLHEGAVHHAHVVRGVPSGRDLVLTLVSPRNGWITDCDGDCMLLVMHFIGIRGRLHFPAPATPILYFDVEALGSSTWKLTFVFEKGKSWCVRFSDFGVHTHDYLKQ